MRQKRLQRKTQSGPLPAKGRTAFFPRRRLFVSKDSKKEQPVPAAPWVIKQIRLDLRRRRARGYGPRVIQFGGISRQAVGIWGAAPLPKHLIYSPKYRSSRPLKAQPWRASSLHIS